MRTRTGSSLMLVLMCLLGLGFNPHSRAESTTTDGSAVRVDLLVAAYTWLKATLDGDFDTQATFYPERVEAFYLWRDVPKPMVMKEKRRVFSQARTIDIDME